MNASIAALLKDRIIQFTYVDKLGGLVRAIKKELEGTVSIIPVAVDVEDALACDDGTQQAMVPDARYACMVYFEDRGVTKSSTRTRGISFESRLRLVCWMNTTKFGGDNYAVDKVAQQFSTVLRSGIYNSGPFIGVQHRLEGMPQRGREIFAAYTYPDAAVQYLMWPYDAFAIDLVTAFRIKAGCEDEVSTTDESCWTPPTTSRRRHPREFTCEELTDSTNGLTETQLSDCLDCDGGTGGSCPYNIVVLVDGVPSGSVSGVDPCVANTLTINLT